MITSLGREDNINELVRNYGMVIVDECHHAAAVTHENVLRAVTARYVYGMSATINRGDKQDKKMFMQLGPIRHRYTAKERAQMLLAMPISFEGNVEQHVGLVEVQCRKA